MHHVSMAVTFAALMEFVLEINVIAPTVSRELIVLFLQLMYLPMSHQPLNRLASMEVDFVVETEIALMAFVFVTKILRV
jgi:hypothetical protein